MTLLLSAPPRALARPVLDLGARSGTALVTPEGSVSYADLAGRAEAVARDLLGPARRLVLVEGAATVDAVATYLAALEHGHPVLLVPPGRPEQRDALVSAYDPDVVATDGPAGWTLTERREGSAHDLHPDLSLLLSTSGSTGSPKLVRLSADNVRANAASIASYLRLSSDDVAATSLPLHYCYGLSVLNSHLVAGGALALTGLSVVDECFWELFREAGATSFAGVPYTFDLLDSSGFAERDLPTLRYVTQAGGRMPADRVRRYAELGRARGWDLVVMYGQTEATARMAYLPPELALERPGAIGVPVPGGRLRVEPVPEAEPGTGELVYEGPNVMLGYAEQPADLALGRTTTELRTGDLGREVDGLFEVVGRRNRQAKVFGLRIDLDRVEQQVAAPVHCIARDDALHVFTTRSRARARVHEAVATLCGLPPRAVQVHVLDEVPRTATGKPDLAALDRHVALIAAPEGVPDEPVRVTPERVRDELALVLGRPDATTASSFVSLGGDSLSYVELATRLGTLLGDLPPSWHTLTAAELAHRAQARRRRTWGVVVDSTVALRSLAIVLIVGTHANLLTVAGGAHLLLAVAGFNLARFGVGDLARRDRVRHGLSAVARVAVPSTVFIGAVGLATGTYDPSTALFLNGALGSDTWTVQWQFWFLEALVWLSLGAVALLAVPAVDRLERRHPFALPATLAVAGLAVRFALTGVETGPTERYSVPFVLWVVALGWAAARATRHRERALVLALALGGMLGYFGDLERELLVVAGVAVLLWVPTVRLPRLVAAPASVLAGASLAIYLTHWQVYPHLEWEHPWLATLLSLGVGVAYAAATRPAQRAATRALRSLRARP